MNRSLSRVKSKLLSGKWLMIIGEHYCVAEFTRQHRVEIVENTPEYIAVLVKKTKKLKTTLNMIDEEIYKSMLLVKTTLTEEDEPPICMTQAIGAEEKEKLKLIETIIEMLKLKEHTARNNAGEPCTHYIM